MVNEILLACGFVMLNRDDLLVKNAEIRGEVLGCTSTSIEEFLAAKGAREGYKVACKEY